MLSSSRYKYIVLKQINIFFYYLNLTNLDEYFIDLTLIYYILTFVARREYIDERHGNITKGKLTAMDITKPIFIILLDRHCEKLVRIFPEIIIIHFILFSHKINSTHDS